VAITDEHMREALQHVRGYSLVLLRSTARRGEPGADAIVWEHGRRNFALREQGVLCIVGPVRGDGDLAGFGIFDAGLDETRAIMDGDPGVQAGIFTYEIHPCVSFPGDRLPE
jgi:hypothetical protein